MRATFVGVTGPDGSKSLGHVLDQLLRGPEFGGGRATLVAAFANAGAALRLVPGLRAFVQAGGTLRVVVGIDHQGTTREALRTFLDEGIETWVFKNRRPGHTFHPKLYVFERDPNRTVLIGSSNLTAGGSYTNYEANVRLDFDLSQPVDQRAYDALRAEVARFLEPRPPLAFRLDAEKLAELVARGDVIEESARRALTERSAEAARRAASGWSRGGPTSPTPYGDEAMSDPPPLPGGVVARTTTRIAAARKRGRAAPRLPLAVRAFYMTLNKLQGETIPGEVRVPLLAVEAAPDFWSWPDRYRTISRSRGKKKRKYREWKPQWDIHDVATATTRSDNVRMYLYPESMDFRFYSSALVAMGGDADDVVKITRTGDPRIPFRCQLYRQTSPAYAAVRALCTQPVRNSDRKWDYV